MPLLRCECQDRAQPLVVALMNVSGRNVGKISPLAMSSTKQHK